MGSFGARHGARLLYWARKAGRLPTADVPALRAQCTIRSGIGINRACALLKLGPKRCYPPGCNDTPSLPLSAMREARPRRGTNHQPLRQRFHQRSAIQAEINERDVLAQPALMSCAFRAAVRSATALRCCPGEFFFAGCVREQPCKLVSHCRPETARDFGLPARATQGVPDGCDGALAGAARRPCVWRTC